MNYISKVVPGRLLFLILFTLQSGYSAAQVPKKTLLKQYEKDKLTYASYEAQHGHFVQTDNVLMHYLSWGDATDTPLIWVHGSLMNAYEMAPLAEALTKAGYYLIAIDYYGHGKTAIPDKEVSLYHIADDIIVLMDSLAIKKAVVGGFSRGGYIASALYQSYPNRVKALILEDGGSVSFNSFHHKMNAAQLDTKANTLNLSNTDNNLYNKSYESDFEAYKSLYDQNTGGSQFEILAIIKPLANKWITYQGLMKHFYMSDATEFTNLVNRPDHVPLYASSITYVQPKIIFRKLNVPMLILDPVSDRDPMPFEQQNIELAALHPAYITRKEYQGIDHNIHFSNPEAFISDLKDFLMRLTN